MVNTVKSVFFQPMKLYYVILELVEMGKSEPLKFPLIMVRSQS